MHRIGHVDILIDHGKIRPQDAKKAVRYNTRRCGACTNVLGPDSKYLRLLVFAKLTVARRLRASFFSGKQPP